MPNKRKYTCKNENMCYNIDNFINEERSVNMLSTVKEMFPEYDSLPTPLTQEKIEQYMSLYFQGDQQAGDTIIAHNLRMVLSLANNIAMKGNYDVKELVREGVFALWRCIDKFDLSRSVKFSTYAYNSISLAMQNYCNRIKRMQAHYQDHIITIDSKTKDLLETTPSKEESIEQDYEDKQVLEIIYQMVEQLNDDDRRLLRMWLGMEGRNYTVSELSNIFGISHTMIHRKLNRIIKNIRVKLQRLGIIEYIPDNLNINGRMIVKK